MSLAIYTLQSSHRGCTYSSHSHVRVAAVDSPAVPSDQRCRAPVQGAKVFYPVRESTVDDTPELSRRLSLQQR